MGGPATEQITTDLRGSLTRLDAAGMQTALALNHAERVQVRSRGTGFHGIAQGMAHAVGLLRTVRAQVPVLAQSVEKGAAPIHETADAANPEQVKAKLAAAAHEVGNARNGIGAVVIDLAQISSHIATVLRGGQPGRLIAIVDGAKQAVAQAADHLDSAQRKITEAANEADQIGAAASQGADPAPAPADRPAAGSGGTGGDETDMGGPPGGGAGGSSGSPEPIPEWISRAAERLPLRPGGKGPTTGALFKPDGTPLTDPDFTVTDGRLRSGRIPGARHGLRPDWYPGQRSVDTDVEGHAAAILRRPDSPDHAEMVINNWPCVTRGRFIGCEDTLRGMLRVGKRLTIYITDGTRTWHHKTYKGTGEGIA